MCISSCVSYNSNVHQKKNKKYGVKWIDNLNKIYNHPSIFIANEFFDALPIKQFIKKKNDWFEKFIVSRNNKLHIVNIKTKTSKIEKIIKQKITNNQTFIEYSPLAFRKLSTISKIIRRQNGGILIIDYGYNKKRMFNTLQSVKNHKKNDFLENIYHSDITHMINFDYYKKKIKKMKLDFIKLTTQKKFLIKMGILQRAEILSKNLTFSKKSDIYFRLRRLIDKKEMGSLFKVLFATKRKNNFKLGF